MYLLTFIFSWYDSKIIFETKYNYKSKSALKFGTKYEYD